LSKITVKTKFAPFSHRPGAKALIPLSLWQVQVFPTKLIFSHSLHLEKPFEVNFDLIGPAQDFTILVDLTKSAIMVHGHFKSGYIRYAIKHENHFLNIISKRGDIPSNSFPVKDKPCIPTKEILFTGIHKAQDVDLIHRRQDMMEIAPLLFNIAQHIPQDIGKSHRKGVAALLSDLPSTNKVQLEDALISIYLSGFEGVFVPRLLDPDHLGIIPSSKVGLEKHSSLILIKELSTFIRSLVFSEDQTSFHLLKNLPPKWHTGKLLNIDSQLATLSIEWSKKFLRRVSIKTKEDVSIKFCLPNKTISFRIGKERYKANDHIDFLKNRTYMLDRFES